VGVVTLMPGMIVFGTPAGAPRDTSPDFIVIGLGRERQIFSGFASNLARQPAQQKKYSLPLCSVLKRAVAGFTSIPQTGSFCLAEDDSAFAVSTGEDWSIVLPEVYLESRVRRTPVSPRGRALVRIALGGSQPLLDTQLVAQEPLFPGRNEK
jgi:hypothetical protein